MTLPTLPATAPRWAVIGLSAAGAYLRMVLYLVASLYALVGAAQLAARTHSPLAVALALTVVGGAGAELLFPGLVTRGTLPDRLARRLAAAPIVVAWVAIAVVLAGSGSAAILTALDALRFLVTTAAVFVGFWTGWGLWHRDPLVVPAFGRDAR